MPVPARISLVTLGVADVEASTRFYSGLGWAPSAASVPGVVTFYATDGGQLALFGRDALAADAGTVPARPHSSVALALNCDSREQVDEVAARWVAAGGAVVKEPAAAAEFEGYAGYLADPDGHLWEVAWNPGFPIGADGRPTLP
ncbi:MAG: VOC family protein [Actinomycetes bacterium]